MSTSHLERQQYEVEALKAIYLEDFQIIGSNEYLLHLIPERGTNGSIVGNIFVELQITLPAFYPDHVPLITIFKKSGLSDDKAAALQKEISGLMEKRLGEEMIFEIAQHVQKFLAVHSVTLYESFYAEMVSRQKRKEHKDAEVRKREEKFRQRLKENEFAKVQARLEERRKKSDQGLENSDIQSLIPENTELGFRLEQISRPSRAREKCCHKLDKVLEFTSKFSVTYVQCLGSCSSERSVFVAKCIETQERVAITEWKFPKDAVPPKKFLPIEQEINQLARLVDCSLVKNFAVKSVAFKSEQVIYLAQEYVEGVSLQEFIYADLPFTEQWCRYFSSLILYCIKFLHDNDVIHRQLRLSSVFVTKELKVVLSDFSIDKKIRDLYDPPLCTLENYPVAIGRSGKKSDIHRFGILILSLYEGRIDQDFAPKISGVLSPDFSDFFAGCLQRDERERLTVEQLLEHPFLVKRPVLTERAPSCEEPLEESDSESESSRDTKDINLNPIGTSLTSRLSNEFEVVKFIGSGGFGEVLKVKNKLDGGVYAIKRILLNTKSAAIFSKITREVQVLSRLNHENVVRYYNSWIEEYRLEKDDFEPASLPVIGSSKKQTLESSVSGFFGSSARRASSSSSESNSDSDLPSDSELELKQPKQNDSESIMFEKDSEMYSSVSSSLDKSVTPVKRSIRCMYIQMEYCERSTLRSAIDNNLYKDERKSWRMFREILEGLSHIHQQGMIHRDLKPANVFLVRGDRIKIGDFGLATTGFLAKPCDEVGSPQTSESGNTGAVGTLLYVAPEVSEYKGAYDKKVDLYSLGMIFFEMSWPPLTTGMERVKIISSLRQKTVAFPLEAAEILSEKKTQLIRLLLDHDPSRRPSAEALLQSSLIPPPELEDATLKETIRHTLANPQSKAFKYLVSSCLGQQVPTLDNIAFVSEEVVDLAKLREAELLTTFVANVFRKHGGVEISVPLLTPKGATLSVDIRNQVQLMNRSGTVVTLQSHARTSIARYIAHCNLLDFRCFSISKSFRERRVLGVHPKEVREASFDIISSENSTAYLAEVIHIGYDILTHNDSVNEKSLCLKLGHAKLIEALLEYTNIDLSQTDKILATFHELKGQTKDRSVIEKKFVLMGISETTANTLLNLLQSEGSVEKVQSVWRSLLRSKTVAASKAKIAFSEISSLFKYLEALGSLAPCTIVISSFLQIPWSIYSGIGFHWTVSTRKRRSKKGEVLAEGGQYSDLVSNYRYRFTLGHTSSSKQTGASGITVFLEGLSYPKIPEGCALVNKGHLDVIVMNLSEENLSKETLTVLKEFWNAGIRAAAPPPFRALEEAQVWCKEMDIPHILATKESESGFYRVRSWDGERFYEKKMARSEAVDYVIRNINQDASAQLQSSRPEQKTGETGNSAGLGVDIVYLFDVKKLAMNTRRRYESQAMAAVDTYAEFLNARAQVIVFCVDIPYSLVQNIAGCFPLDDLIVEKLISGHPRYRVQIRKIWEYLEGSGKNVRKVVYALFSIDDLKCKLLF